MSPSLPTLAGIDLTPGPDLHPLYPHPSHVAPLLAPSSGLSPQQRKELVTHCLTRACVFGDIQVLSYLLSDPQAQAHVDLNVQDDDGLGLITVAILGFGADSDRDVEREECVRLLVQEGANPNLPDNVGWTALHHASLFSPPTLVSYLLTHGCSPLTPTRRNLTAFDIVTGYSQIPGREDIALLLEEAMREEGWTGGGSRERQRKIYEERERRRGKRREIMTGVGRVLGLADRWWGDDGDDDSSDDDEDYSDVPDDTHDPEGNDFSTMLVFSPSSLPYILHSLITTRRPTLRSCEAAKALHLLSRFACISCDHNWLEDVIVGAVDKIEEVVYNQPDDVVHLAFWLYNTTILLHLLRTDPDVAETCDILGLFVLLEELLNAIYVFIIRIAERRIDPLLDTAILEYVPPDSAAPLVQFEGDWSFFRTLRGKKATVLPPQPSSPGFKSGMPASPLNASRPSSPAPGGIAPSTSAGGAARFATLKGALTKEPATTGPHPRDIVTTLEALHTLLLLAGTNPAIIVQAYAQIFYWSACELFNRLLTRKKYLCRSRAVDIERSLSVIEDWVHVAGLPPGVLGHMSAVKDMLHWLQVQSSIDQFANLVAEIQTMRALNPLQMRRAVRDYRYEVSEGRMTDECSQYLAQLQKDWERHRVKMGVEAIRKEISEKERERDDSASMSSMNGGAGSLHHVQSVSGDSLASDMTQAPPPAQQGIDALFDRGIDKAQWAAPRPPEALGELLDSRCMLPLVLPSDAQLLACVPGQDADLSSAVSLHGNGFAKPDSGVMTPSGTRSQSRSRASINAMEWAPRMRKVRQVGVELLDSVDGVYSLLRRVQADPDEEKGGQDDEGGEGDSEEDSVRELTSASGSSRATSPHFTANPSLHLKPSENLRARSSTGGAGVGDEEEDDDVGIAL